MPSYVPILILGGVAVGFAVFTLFVSQLLGRARPNPQKSAVYECGVPPIGTARERFPIKLYLVAIVFILFDIEVVFLWSWMTVFKNSEWQFQVFSFVEMIAYMITWVVGYVYMLRVGAIDWDDTATLDPAKLGESTLEVAS